MAASATSFLLLTYALSSFSPVLAQIVISKNFSTYNVALETPVNTLSTIGTTTVSTTLPQSLYSSKEPDLRNSTFSSDSSNNTRLEVISTTPTSNESNHNDINPLEISTSTTGNNASKRNGSYSITDTIYPATPEGSSGFVTQTPSSERTITDNRTTQGSETTTIDPKGLKEEPSFKRQNISELLSLSSSSTAPNLSTTVVSSERTTLLGLLGDKNQNTSEPADAIANGTSNTTPPAVTNITGDQHLILSQRLYELCQSPPKSVKCFGDKRNCFKTSNCTFLGVVQESNSHINVSLVTQVYDATKDSINVTILLRRGSKANSSDFKCDRVSFKSIQINIQPRRKNQTIIPETRCSAAMIDKRELQSDCEQAIGRNSTFQPEETLGMKFTVSDTDATKLIPLGFQHVGPKEPQVRQGRKMNLTSALPHESDKLSIDTTTSAGIMESYNVLTLLSMMVFVISPMV